MQQDFKNKIISHSRQFPQEEVCGALVLYKYDGLRLVTLKNYHEDRANFFSIDPREFISLKKRGEVLAIYHSHPDVSCEPSEYDKKISKELGVPFYIYSLADDDFYLFIPRTYQPELMGRVYVEDVLNCVMFAKNYYEQKLGLKCSYEDNYFEIDSKRSANVKIVKNIVDSGFIEIEKKDLQKHDLIIFKGFSEDQFYHLGMYDGEGNFFHHCVDSLSKVDIFDERHQRLVYKTYRYKGHD